MKPEAKVVVSQAMNHLAKALFICGCITWSSSVVFGQNEIASKKFLQHERVVGAGKCIECHESEVSAWRATPHYENKDLHTKDKAREIARKMGIASAARIRSSQLCVQCHFTAQKLGNAPSRVIDGVSCESCHGGAKHWLDIHNTGDRRDGNDTTAARTKAVEAGMLPPDDYCSIAQNCFSCHIVTDEKLVNVGGHPAGSADFELVAWLEGMVRHNFFASNGKTNDATPIERRRMLYIAGVALDLEYSLRGLARAKKKADYGKFMGRSTQTARTALNSIVKTLAENAPEQLEQMITAVNKPGLLKFFNVGPLTAAADSVSASLKDFCRQHNGHSFGAIDGMLPTEGRGPVFQP